MKTTFALAAALLIASAGAALANKAAADGCAANLDANGQAIYSAAIGSIGSTDLTDLVKSKTRALVMAGTISQGDARGAAMAAGKCLSMAQ